MGATLARIRRLESRMGATGDPYQGFTFVDYVKAADAGMKVSEAPLGLQRMHRSMQLTALACELRRTGVAEGIEVGDLETAIVEVGQSFGLPRDLIDKEIAHNRARYAEEVAIYRAHVEARARGAAEAAPAPRPPGAGPSLFDAHFLAELMNGGSSADGSRQPGDPEGPARGDERGALRQPGPGS